ncbi:MAG: hypothetical protein SNJ81_16860, partial [Cyanobacteriota bacterium]
VILALRSSVPKGSEVLSDLDAREIHSVDTYRLILASGSPIYRLPSPEDLYAISNWILKNPVRQVDLGTAIEEIVTALNEEVSSEIVKFTLLSFISAEMFIQDPESVQVSEQKLSFRDDIHSLEAVIRILKTGVMKKIKTILPSVNEEVLRQILPDAS